MQSSAFTGIELFIEQYGAWAGLLLYFFYKEVWPLISKKLIPAKLKDIDEQRAARISELKEERDFHNMIEKERLKAQQEMTQAVQTLVLSMIETSERVTHILDNQTLILTRQDSMAAILNEGISDMRAYTGVGTGKGSVT